MRNAILLALPFVVILISSQTSTYGQTPSTTKPSSTAIDFKSQIQPLIESACLHCHMGDEPDGGLRLESRQAAMEGGDSGPAIVTGEPEESPFYTLAVLPPDDDQIMPPEGPPWTKVQSDLIRSWIAAGAEWPADIELQVQPRIDFVQHVQPILERNCLSCHSSDSDESDYDLSTRDAALEGDETIVPFRPNESRVYSLTVLAADDDELMPPVNAGGPLPKDVTDPLRLWIAQGAIWPDNLTLKAKAKTVDRSDSPDNLELVKRIHAKILETSQGKSVGAMADYASKVPRTGADYHMVAIPGGEFLMGSPPGESHRTAAEGPQSKVTVGPFWIGKYEVTWDEYEPFMITQVDRKKHGARVDFDPAVHTIVDAVSQPTAPYMEMSFGMGQSGYPAISMTQHAASKYCQWLSAQTGHFYRLPTEAEWEYACRAGTTTAYSFGDDPGQLGQYAWYYDNSNEKYQKVGKKKPNAWGLHDMHGNVMEWTLDQFSPDYFREIAPSNPFLKPDKLYPRAVRGGGWDDDPENLRSAYRKGSDPIWKQQDPQLPKSIWYHTDAQWLGFRIIRPLEVPSVEEMYLLWNSATGAK